MTRPRSYRVCKAPITADLISGRRGHPDGWQNVGRADEDPRLLEQARRIIERRTARRRTR